MTEIYSGYLNAPVVLTEAAIEHIQDEHKNTYPLFRQEIVETVSNPDTVRRSAKDGISVLFEKWFDTALNGRFYIVATIRRDSNSYRIKTAFPSKKPAKGEVLWRKN
ncbi:MAG: hypothetical protein ACRC8A_17205 [Microcoleaceae cyanobacterium]